MKKLVLTSVAAVLVATGAHAANVINGDPLYMPAKNHFYSITSVGSDSEHIDDWGLGQEFGYGITDRIAVMVAATADEEFGFHRVMWNDLTLGLNLRAFDIRGWKADVYGKYIVDGVWPDHEPFMDHHNTEYTWMIGVRTGYTTGAWTIAAHADYDYANVESFKFHYNAFHTMHAGIDGLYSVAKNWSLVAGIEYRGVLNNTVKVYNPFIASDMSIRLKNWGRWNGTIGVNYNIDDTKFVGLYVRGDLQHEQRNFVNRNKDWEFKDGFSFGAKFGIDF